MSDSNAKAGGGSWGFGVLGFQLLFQGAFFLLQNALENTAFTQYAHVGLGVLALLAGVLILLGK